MNIGIDARLYGIQHAGIGRYTEYLVTNLLELDRDNQYFLFVENPELIKLKAKNLNIITAPYRHYTLREQLGYKRLLDQYPLDLMHFTHFNVPLLYSRPYIVTIHDLLWHEKIGFSATTLNPAIYLIKYLGYRLVINHAVSRARHILVPSEIVKKNLIHNYPDSYPKTTVTLEAPSPVFAQKIIKQAKHLKLPENKFLVYTGSLYPHKNVATLIEVLTQIPEISLVIISSRNIFMDKTKDLITRLNLDDRVRFMPGLKDNLVKHVYSQAAALVQPSLSEGFGLTGLEAMAAGLPVICSDIPIFHEIYGQAAVYANTKDSHQLAQQINTFLQDPISRNRLIELGHKQAAQYSWRKTAQSTLEVYNLLISRVS
jgi:glycosyltransferase involved in cell wall biosynthesis